MSEIHPFERRLAECWPAAAWHDLTVLVAVSGGADSVALLRGLVRLKTGGAGRLIVAHFNHRLRGAASDADQMFVQQLCQTLRVECRVGRWASDAAPAGANATRVSESAARSARYAFLKDVARQSGSRYVATAHTFDDQVETVLHRILRGTGIEGLGGMRQARELVPGVALIRPLLSIRRQQVIGYLADLDQPYCRDATNEERDFTRNRIRLDLLPKLAEQYNPRIADSLVRLARLADEARQVIDDLVQQRVQAAVFDEGKRGIRVDCRPLKDERPYLIRQVLIHAWKRRGWPVQAMGLAEWESLAELVQAAPSAESPRRDFPGGVSAARSGEWLVLRPRSDAGHTPSDV